MKFNRHKTSNFEGEAIVRYEHAQPERDGPGLTLTASPRGVYMGGELRFTENADLQAFAKALSDAWKDHLSLKPKIVTSLAGH